MLRDYNIHQGGTLHLVRRLRGGMPLSPSPSTRDGRSPTYTRWPPRSNSGTTGWTVSAEPDGTLVEKDTGLELSYLFWEADSNATLPPSAPLGPTDALTETEYFDDTPTAALLPFVELLPYLDATLKELSLHTAARNDFITYWLPKLPKKPFVALRFLPQVAYDRAAALEVQPAPEVVTRVFMLFRRVSAEDAEDSMWSAARARVGEVDWVEVVGVKEEARDQSRFRVLEWGAMEVL